MIQANHKVTLITLAKGFDLGAVNLDVFNQMFLLQMKL